MSGINQANLITSNFLVSYFHTHHGVLVAAAFVDEQYVASSIYVCRGQVLMGVEGKELDAPGFRQTLNSPRLKLFQSPPVWHLS